MKQDDFSLFELLVHLSCLQKRHEDTLDWHRLPKENTRTRPIPAVKVAHRNFQAKRRGDEAVISTSLRLPLARKTSIEDHRRLSKALEQLAHEGQPVQNMVRTLLLAPRSTEEVRIPNLLAFKRSQSQLGEHDAVSFDEFSGVGVANILLGKSSLDVPETCCRHEALEIAPQSRAAGLAREVQRSSGCQEHRLTFQPGPNLFPQRGDAGFRGRSTAGVCRHLERSIQAGDDFHVKRDVGFAGLGASSSKLTAVHAFEGQLPASSLVLEVEDLDHEEARPMFHVEDAYGRSSGIEHAAFIPRNDVLEVPGVKGRVEQHVGIELIDHTNPSLLELIPCFTSPELQRRKDPGRPSPDRP